jgi:hypothetical protein
MWDRDQKDRTPFPSSRIMARCWHAEDWGTKSSCRPLTSRDVVETTIGVRHRFDPVRTAPASRPLRGYLAGCLATALPSAGYGGAGRQSWRSADGHHRTVPGGWSLSVGTWRPRLCSHPPRACPGPSAKPAWAPTTPTPSGHDATWRRSRPRCGSRSACRINGVAPVRPNMGRRLRTGCCWHCADRRTTHTRRREGGENPADSCQAA